MQTQEISGGQRQGQDPKVGVVPPDPIRPIRRIIPDYEPNPLQAPFHASPAYMRWIFGGSAAGKSRGACMEVFIQCLRYPHNLWVIARDTLVDLKRTTRVTFKEEVIPPEIWSIKGVQWREADQTLILPNKSQIILMGLDEPGRLGSLNLGGFMIDESHLLRNPAAIMFAFMRQMRRRGPNGSYIRHCGILAGHPVGKGHYYYQNFIAKPRVGWKYFQGSTFVNKKNLPPGFPEGLVANLPPDYAKRYVYGECVDFVGQVFSEFDEQVHVIDPFEIPAHWIRYRGMDYGIREPSVCEWCAVDEKGNAYFYDELYVKNCPIPTQVKAIDLKTLDDQILMTVFDARSAGLRQQTDSGLVTIAQQYQACGLAVSPSATGDAGSIDAGILAIKTLLAMKRVFIMRPGVVKGRVYGCPELIRELQTFSFRELREDQPETDKYEDGNDHCISTARYIIGRHFGTSLVPVKAKKDIIAEDIKREIARSQMLEEELGGYDEEFAV